MDHFSNVLSVGLAEPQFGSVQIESLLFSISTGLRSVHLLIFVFPQKNASDDGTWTIHNARNRSEEFGIVKEWNGDTELPWWKGDKCNQLNGTDGTMYRPFLNESASLYIYLPDMCRSIKLERTENVYISGVQAYRYHPVMNTFDGMEKNPDNWCFCTSEDKKECARNGIFNLGPCSDGKLKNINLLIMAV